MRNGGKTMANKKFTEEEMGRLRENPYVLHVTPSQVHLSADFKQKFWDGLLAGERPRDIVISHGLDPDILGDSRINGIKIMVKNEMKSGKGFRDISTYREFLDTYITPEVKVRFLEQQLAYKNQEIEFLKKIVSLSREEADS
jgi:hypothetical protein